MKMVSIYNSGFDVYMTIDFVLTTTCNYSCHYCFPGCNDGSIRWPTDIELLKKNFGHLLNIYQKQLGKDVIRIELIGGEVTLWPHLSEFARWIKTNFNVIIMLTTNGSRTLRWWKDNAKYFDNIQLSLHPGEGNVHHIIDVADFVFDNTDNHVAINVLMDPTEWSKSIQNVEILKARPTEWAVKLKMIMQEKVIDPRYTQEQIRYLETRTVKMPSPAHIKKVLDREIYQDKVSTAVVKLEDGSVERLDIHKLWEHNNHNFTGWNCNLGIDRITIQGGGNIQGSCGAMNLFDHYRVFNIFDTEFVNEFSKEIIGTTTCRQPFCGCTSDVVLSKTKNQKKILIPVIEVK